MSFLRLVPSALVAASSTLPGCAGQPAAARGRVAVVAIEQPTPAGAREPEQPPAPNDRPGGCALALSVLSVEKKDTCHLETAVGLHARGKLEFPCDRKGAARAVISGDSFEGAIADGELHLHYERRYEYEDGCTWHTQQRIDGRVDDRRLLFTYAEEAPGQTGCFGPCDASAVISLEPLEDSSPSEPANE